MDKDLDEEPCGNCLTTDRVNFYCKDCAKALCVACKTSHSGYSAKKLHEVVPRTTEIQDIAPKNGINCKFHRYEVYQAVCRSCDMIVCPKCIARQHRTHAFTSIDNVIREKKFVVEQEIKSLKRLRLPQLNRVLAAADHRTSELERVTEQLKLQVMKHSEKLKREIDAIQDDLFQVIVKREKKDRENLRREKKQIEAQISIARDLVETSEEEFRDSKRNVPALFDFLKETHEKVSELQKDIQPVFPVKSNFIAGSVYRSRLAEMFGKIEIKKEQEKEVFTQLGMNKNEVMATDIDDTVLSSFETNSKYIISYMCPVNGNGAWMRTSSSHVALVKMDGAEIKHLKVDLNIEDMTMTKSGDFFATSLTTGHLNHILKISSRGKVVVFANTFPAIPYGLYVTREGELLVCLHRKGDSYLARMSQAGRIVQKIKYNEEGGEPLFVKPYRVTQNGNGDMAVVDVGPKKVLVLDKYGAFRYDYDGSKSQIRNTFSPRSITRDKFNNFLVADHENDAVHVIDKDGNIIRLITSGVIEKPITVRVTSDGKIWISQNGTKVNVLRYLAE